MNGRDPARVLRGRGRRRFGAALALMLGCAAVAALVLGPSSSPQAAAGPTSPSGTTAVQRRDLVETDTQSGTLSYESPQTVYNRLSGTITWLPSIGQLIKPGDTLFRVAGEPVILMNGTTPAYRDLGPSDSPGPDILQLNRNLAALGFNPDGIVRDDTWQAATSAGVDVLEAYLGEPETGSLALGHVVFLPGDQLVSALEATLGSDGGGSGGASSSSSSAGFVMPPPAPEFASFDRHTTSTPTGSPPGPVKKKTRGRQRSANRTKELEALIALLRAETAELRAAKNSPGKASGHAGASAKSPRATSSSASPSSSNPPPSSSNPPPSSGGASPTAILQTTSTRLVATVDLDASKQSEAKVGEKVRVELPSGSQVNGTISAVSPVAQVSTNGGGNNGSGSGGGNGNGNGNGSSGASIPVTITLSGRISGAGLDQAPVSVNFIQAVANNVLSVPVTALLATAGGGYAVQAARLPHKLIPVTTGLFAAGYVAVSGPGIYPGLQVTDSQG